MEWEYKSIETKTPVKQILIEELNQLGSEGWDVVNYNEIAPDKFGGDWKFNVLLKRQKSTKQIL
jgi:predicted type IV restriction endonuclease